MALGDINFDTAKVWMPVCENGKFTLIIEYPIKFVKFVFFHINNGSTEWQVELWGGEAMAYGTLFMNGKLSWVNLEDVALVTSALTMALESQRSVI